MEKNRNRILAAILAANTLVTAGCTAFNKKADDDKVDEEQTTIVMVDENKESSETDLVATSENEEVIIVEDNKSDEETVKEEQVSESVENITTQDDALSTENFITLVANYAKVYAQNNLPVTTEDITKFVSIANIDKLVEDNKEYAAELFEVQEKEEYLNDAAKVIGATVMYNGMLYNENGTTEGFIKVSDAIVGPQKDKAILIEDYTDRIVEAVKTDDSDAINNLVSEFITELNSGSLSKLDDGVGFVVQVNIALIADFIAKDYLNQENFDNFEILKTSEKYVSNIFTEYEGCQLTRTKSK